jgi:FKBP-type peptidyl-prolyl cis-trans isomerase 2
MPFEKGSFILMDYVGKVVETGEVFDTTLEETAKKEDLYQEGGLYEPRLIVIGEGWVLKTLDEGLINLEMGKTATIEIPAEKAFGNRDPEKIRLYPLRKLIAQGVTPRVGMRIDVDGKIAIVRTIGSGRVQLDFNPPLAGKTLTYEVTVQKKLETAEEKIMALIHRRIPPVNVDKFSLEIKEDEVAVNIPEEAFYVEGLQVSKRGIFIDLQKFFPEKKTVKFVETFKKPEPAEATPSPAATPAGTEGSQ